MDIEDIEYLIAQKEGVMLYFSGQECSVCDALKPKIKEVMDINFPRIEQIYINASQNIEIAAQAGVFSFPTIIVYLNSKEFIREGASISLVEFAAKLSRPYGMMFE